MPYYPDQRFVSDLATLYREVMLPDEALGDVIVREGQAVDIRENVARGMIASRHIIIEAARELRLKDRDALEHALDVTFNTRVEVGQVIASNGNREVTAPVTGVLVHVTEGRIIMQEMPEIFNLEAGVRGDVVRVYPGRGVAIEAVGAVVQGVWGNGGSVISTLQMEPPGGIERLSQGGLDTTFKGMVVVTQSPLNRAMIDVAIERGFAGLIAPSMDASLMPLLTDVELHVMLTEGFGQIRMSRAIIQLLEDFDGQQLTLDAFQPQRWSSRRPELVINIRTMEEVAAPDWRLALQKGMRVRISREPHMGATGNIVSLLPRPVLLDNGLRVAAAGVDLHATGEIVVIPLANLELAGR